MAKEKDPAKIPMIFDAALNLVLERGFVALTMAEVARKAGLATGTLYVYFKNKETLIEQLYLDVKSKKIAGLCNALSKNDSFYNNFKRLWTDYFLHCLNHPQHMQFVVQFCDSGYVSAHSKAVLDPLTAPVLAFFEQAQADMLIVDLPVPALFAHITGSTHTLVKYHLDYDLPVSDELLSIYFLLAWNGIRK